MAVFLSFASTNHSYIGENSNDCPQNQQVRDIESAPENHVLPNITLEWCRPESGFLCQGADLRQGYIGRE